MNETFTNGEFTLSMVGLDDLQKKLETFPRNVARRLFREVLIFAARAWRDEMEARAPKLESVKLSENPREVRIPGDLARHIGMQVMVNADLQAAVRVGPSKRTYWGLFQELGRRAAARGSRIFGRKGGGASYMKPRAFVRPAFESKSDEVINRLADGLTIIIAEETRKNV